MSLSPTERFSDRVDHYIRYRPGYPSALIDWLVEHCGLAPSSVVADVGSGTGNLARLFLQHGCLVYGIEPNDAMRQASQRLLDDFPRFTALATSAEATGLPSNRVDFVSAGQAFHWFDPAGARREFRRILRPDGWVVLVWNDRQLDSTPFLRDYEQLLRDYAVDYQSVGHKRIGPAEVEAMLDCQVQALHLDNVQLLDREGVRGRLLSSSYAPLPGHPNHAPMMEALDRGFEAHQVDGLIALAYTTVVYCAQFL